MKILALDLATRWKPIPGYEGKYEVSDSGLVRSLTGRPKILNTNHAGRYAHVQLSRDNRQKNFNVQRLVLLAFRGPCPEGHEAAHLDGNKRNNRLENLCWKTHIDNELDKETHGTVGRGTANGCAKITEADVLEIRDLRRRGASLKSIAEQFGITFYNVSCICLRKTWRHV